MTEATLEGPMMTFVRKLRGALGLGALWGLTWYVVAAVTWSVMLFGQVSFGFILNLAAGVGVGGAVVGVAFSGLLGVAERSKTFEDLSYLRLTGLGALGGALVTVPLLGQLDSSIWLPFVSVLAAMGATSAAGSLALARRADDPELGGGEHPALPHGIE